MSSIKAAIRKSKVTVTGAIISLVTGAQVSATDMTAGVILKEMPAGERAAYVMGIIEGFAYARFRKDTAAAGVKDEIGMKCIYDWFYADAQASLQRIDATFEKYANHFPSTLLAAMIKKECGE